MQVKSKGLCVRLEDVGAICRVFAQTCRECVRRRSRNLVDEARSCRTREKEEICFNRLSFAMIQGVPLRRRYEAAFILPLPNEKRLTDDGWEFSADTRLPEATRIFLATTLGMQPLERFAGEQHFVSPEVDASALEDDSGAIELVHIKLYDMRAEHLLKMFDASSLAATTELFFPPSWKK